jgi:hypothetical protein
MMPTTIVLRSLLVLLLCSGLGLFAAEGPDLANRQTKLAGRYAKLEELLVKMAKLEAANNPRRANLLQQAMELSKDKHTRLQLESIATLLGKQQLARAIREQTDVEGSLAELLKLLQSEDRSTELKTEQERIREYIKEVERMIRIQRSLQGQNEGQADAQQLAQEQEKLADRAQDLADKIRAQEEKQTNPGTSPENAPPTQPDEKTPSQPPTQPKEKPPGESKPSEPKPGEAKPNEAENPSENESQPGVSGEQESPATDQKQENPVRSKIEQARARMKGAQQKLAEAQRQASQAEQAQAREELEKAKAELERILKQLREEEMERTLTALEARFRKMLEMQVKVFEGTKKLDALPSDQRTREHDVQAGRLGADETKIAIEAEKALQLLQEEGSSVAFPATVEQMVDDMRSVAERLNLGKTEQLTQGLEEDIIACLEELLAALQQAQKEMEEKKQESSQPMQPMGGEQESPLVNAIQELKMIKSLQLRVNTRTNRYARMLKDENDPIGQAGTAELTAALRKLGEREKQVFEIVRELLLGRNQ